MAEIIPFAGLRYDRGRVGDLDLVVAPPYDVISEAHKEELYGRHGHNIVRIDFGKSYPEDTPAGNRYTRAATSLREWVEDGVLVREDAPALYFYEVDYKTPAGEPRLMRGFICMLKLAGWDEGVVLPHEGTLKGPKADRFELLLSTGASASQIFSLYSDPERRITEAMLGAVGGRRPDAEAKDLDGAAHRLWAVKDPDAIRTARTVMEARKVFIADGHHRYETALAYRDHWLAMGGKTGGEPFNYVPMFLSNMDEEGLTILPTHRLITESPGLGLGDILDRASKYFDVEEFPFTEGEATAVRKEFLETLVKRGRSSHAFGFYFDKGSSYQLMTLKELDPVTEALRCRYSQAYCNLDVTILHELIIERVLGIDTGRISESQPVQFEKDGETALGRVASGEFAMCFLLNATKVREVKQVALAREIMPQKSTYFYPKLLTGMVIAELTA